MIQKLVDTMINKQIEKKVLKTEEIRIYQYGYILLYEVVLNLIFALNIGLIFGELKMISFFLFMYIPLRSFCGGWHADKIWKCTIISNIILLLQILGERFLAQNIVIYMIIGLFVFCLISILHMAPVETESKKINTNERRIYKKRIYCITLIQAVVFVVLVLVDAKKYIFSMSYVYVVQNAMLVLEMLKNVTVQKMCDEKSVNTNLL